MLVPSTTHRALSNGMLRFSIAQIMTFGIIDGSTENVKIIIWAMENLSIPLDRFRRRAVGTIIGDKEEV
jgi:hypothetical protein